MKKISILFCLVSIMVLTGCGSKNDQVVCTSTVEQSGITLEQEITINFKSDKVDTAEFVMNAKFDEEYKSYASYFVTTLESQFESYEETYGITVNVKETSDGAKIDFKMDQSTYEKMYGSADAAESKDDVISDLEDQGYTCK